MRPGGLDRRLVMRFQEPKCPALHREPGVCSGLQRDARLEGPQALGDIGLLIPSGFE